MTTATEQEPHERTVDAQRSDADAGAGLRRQWLGLLLAPAVFFAHLQGAYLLAPLACRTGSTIWLHAAGVLAVSLASVGVLMAWLAFRQTGSASPGDGHGSIPRARLLAISGLAMSSLFVLIIAAQWIAGFIVPPCA